MPVPTYSPALRKIPLRIRRSSEYCKNPQAIEPVQKALTLEERQYPSRLYIDSNYWNFVNKQPNGKGCWIWVGARSHDYGLWKGKLAHRYHFQNLKSTDYVCHHCDNKLCVNPDHLYVGTAKTNCQDRFKSTNIFGELRHEQFLERNSSL